MNKTIHYFWFGNNPKPKIFFQCLESWKKWLPEWDIKEWNENNVDVNINEYTRNAYSKKNWSFVSDYFRCSILEEYGGLYLDIDVEIIGNLNELLKDKPFLGFEYSGFVASGLIMYFPKAHHPVLKDMMKIIEAKSKSLDNQVIKTTMVYWFTDYLKEHGLVINDTKQEIVGVTIYPCEYFCPISPTWKFQRFTKNTYTLHHYYGSWFSKKAMNQIKLKRYLFKSIHPINMLKLRRIRMTKL